jgi:uncharacterized membrane protein YphA (DoxX/SURF4 family)
MNTVLWITQSFIALAFCYSGLCKSYFSEQKLVAMGQTGVEGLPLVFTRFIGVSEIIGALGLILPHWINVYPILTPIAAFCLAFIMPFAAVIHYKRNEYRNVITNVIIFGVCLFIAWGRLRYG